MTPTPLIGAPKPPAETIEKKCITPRPAGLDVTTATDKQGSRLVRWAAVEAVQRVPDHTRLGKTRDRVAARRGRNIGKVAAARQLLELVYYALRDGKVRALTAPIRTAAATNPP